MPLPKLYFCPGSKDCSALKIEEESRCYHATVHIWKSDRDWDQCTHQCTATSPRQSSCKPVKELYK